MRKVLFLKGFWLIVISALTLTGLSCQSQESEEGSKKSGVENISAEGEVNIPNELVSSSSEYIMDDGPQADGYIINRDKFIKPYVSSEISGDTLIASTLFEINSCAETIGNIIIRNDSLFLETKVIGTTFCTSTEFHQFKYTIVMDSLRKYALVF